MLVRSLLLGVAVSGLSLAASVPAQPTFYKNVLPVMQARCQECHRPGEAAPMSFMTYKDARPWAKAPLGAVCWRDRLAAIHARSGARGAAPTAP